MASRVRSWCVSRWSPLVSAALYLLAFPPFDFWPLIFVAIVPMLYQLRDADSKQAWRIGYTFGVPFYLGQMFWLYDLTNNWIHRPWLALVPWILCGVVGALFFGWTCRLIRHCYIRGWLLMIPVAWVGVEVCRSYIPVVAFPWGLAATPLYTSPFLIQSAHFGTIYLVSAFVVLINVTLAALTDRDLRQKTRPLVIATLGVLILSAFQYRSRPPSDPFPVTVAQPGVDLAFGNHQTERADIAENVNAIGAAAAVDGSRLMVLPEGIGDDSHYPPRPPFILDKRLPVLFGGQRGTGPVYQTAFSFDGRWHYADKTRLVIMGEFVPGRDSIPWLTSTFHLPTGDLSASPNGVHAVDVAGVRAGPMLCFEGLFPDISYRQALNGARFIAVMCIDDWYMGTATPEQLKAASFFRAVETGLPLVRSASLGYTLAIDGHGKALGELPLKRPAGLRVTLDLPRESTVFPLLPVFPVLAGLFALSLPWLPRKRAAKPASTN